MIKVGEVRIADDTDFDAFIELCDQTTGWVEEFSKKGITLWTRNVIGSHFGGAGGVPNGTAHQLLAEQSPSSDEGSVRMAKVRTVFTDIAPALLYDVLHDPDYRSVWDKNMETSVDVARINPCNDIGYYAMNLFPPIAPRDFVLQRSWIKKPNSEEYIIFNHSVHHRKYPPKRGYVRAISYVTGFLLRGWPDPKAKNPRQCQFTYLTYGDPRGSIPTWAVNKMSRIVGPRTAKHMRKVALKYPEWKRTHRPNWKPWLYPEQMETQRINWDDVIISEEIEHPLARLGIADVAGQSGATDGAADELVAAERSIAEEDILRMTRRDANDDDDSDSD